MNNQPTMMGKLQRMKVKDNQPRSKDAGSPTGRPTCKGLQQFIRVLNPVWFVIPRPATY